MNMQAIQKNKLNAKKKLLWILYNKKQSEVNENLRATQIVEGVAHQRRRRQLSSLCDTARLPCQIVF
jgi:hypothetical protein